MELPKNITQIGEADPHCKIYIEDYVISYLKQVNRKLDDKKIGLSLYGVCKEENDIRYYFFYGAAPNPFLTVGTRYLSQAILQEAEKQRKRFFMNYDFLGYIIPDGGMPESMYLYEQGIATEMFGYARFYEQNDGMLNFLLSEQKESEQPTEQFATDKYEMVRKRREERKQQSMVEREKKDRPKGKGAESVMPAAACLMLVVLGLSTPTGKEWADKLRQSAANSWTKMQEQQLPVSAETGPESLAAGKVVTEDKLTEALQKENSTYPVMSAKIEESLQPTAEPLPVSFEEEPSEETPVSITSSPAPESTPTPAPTPEPTPAVQETETKPTAAHVVKKGDTLMGISWKYYGTGEQLDNICKYNNIKDPNDIKIGQKILLP